MGGSRGEGAPEAGSPFLFFSPPCYNEFFREPLRRNGVYPTSNEAHGEAMDDQTIIECVLNGDVNAYALLVRKYHRNLLAFIFRLVRDPHLAEDIGQEVFLNVYKELPRFDTGRGTPFAAWLFIVARNQCIDELRRRRRAEPAAVEQLERLAAGGESAEEALLRREELAALAATVRDLPEPFRATIIMSLKGATLDEIARKSGVPRATVKTRLFRAKEKVALVLKEHFGGVGHERRV